MRASEGSTPYGCWFAYMYNMQEFLLSMYLPPRPAGHVRDRCPPRMPTGAFCVWGKRDPAPDACSLGGEGIVLCLGLNSHLKRTLGTSMDSTRLLRRIRYAGLRVNSGL